MFIPHNAYQSYNRTPTVPARPQFKILPAEAEVPAENTPISDPQWEDFSINYAQENGFFKGFLVALPVSISFWVIIIWVIKAFFF